MDEKWIVLVADEAGSWGIAVQSADREAADNFYLDMIQSNDPSPIIKLNTGDFIQFKGD